MANVSFDTAALDEYQRAVAWYVARNARAAKAFTSAVSSILAAIGSQPDRYAWYDLESREAAVSGYPYSVIYRALPSGDVQVIAIAHASREPGYWRGRA